MLLRLRLREFVIVESAELSFDRGLNVLTGETGAGKSILVDAIGLLAGSRGSSEWVRRGAERLVVEGALDLTSTPRARDAAARHEIPLEDGVLLVRREISADGRSRCVAGDRQVLVSQLRELTAGVLWSVGQGEQRVLAEPAEQEAILDRFGGAGTARARYQTERAAFLEAGSRCAELAEAGRSFAGEEAFLRAQIEEIREADPTPGERARLRAAVVRARERGTESALSEELEARLVREEGSVLDHLETLVHRLGSADSFRWGELRDQLASIRDQVHALRLPSSEEEEEGNLEAMEERLRTLERLCRRYGDPGGLPRGDAGGARGGADAGAVAGVVAGADVGAVAGADADADADAGTDADASADVDPAEAAVLARLSMLEERLVQGASLAERLSAAVDNRERARAAAAEAGSALFALRARAAESLARAVAEELAGLGMATAKVRFAFHREPDADGVPAGESGERVRPLEGGLERVRLLFQTHPTEAEGDLARIASGGELSRVLLALHAALGEGSPPGCWVLDEVDVGIGGETARRVAARLSRMAEHAQVLLVTHLPAIAARAQRHLCVVKEEVKGRPAVRIDALAGDSRVRELARMLAGEPDSPTARRLARALLSAEPDAER